MASNARTARDGFGADVASFLIESDPGLLSDLEGLINGDVSWDEIPDEPGIDVLTGNPIPDGATEA